MLYSKIPLSQTVIALCQLHNIKHIVISPGSRNAPLTIGFTNHIFFKCYSIVDERCAAFFALGIAQQLQQPVALVCTSGSALLNYYPAIAEAYYSNVPLVVLSADRPKHLIDIGDGQTIKQKNVYGKHVLYSANLKLDMRTNAIDKKTDFVLNSKHQYFNEKKLYKAFKIAATKLGPVHVNIPFNEPLYETTEIATIHPQPYVFEPKKIKSSLKSLKKYSAIWNASKRKIILVGVLQPNSIEEKYLQQLAKDDSVLVFTETTSNSHHPDFFPGIDKLIAPLDTSDFEKLHPEILITLGGLLVSKKIKVFLRTYQPKHHWHIGLTPANNTFFCLKHHFKCTINSFLEAFLPTVNIIESNYKPHWLSIRNKHRAGHASYIKTIPFSDFLVFHYVLKSLPKASQLQVGNSSAIRYTQLFQMPKHITVFCNRGTSGIDGSTSTAIGAALVAKQNTTFITGDLSFFYDSNALWNAYIPNTFRIIMINNYGGGIFRILPGHKNTTNFDTYFETKHQFTAKQLCEMYNLEYISAIDEVSLKHGLTDFYDHSEQPKLLEVFTPSTLNDGILLDYFKFIK